MAGAPNAAERRQAALVLAAWEKDAALAGLRGGAAGRLPEAERAGWARLWAEAAARRRAGS